MLFYISVKIISQTLNPMQQIQFTHAFWAAFITLLLCGCRYDYSRESVAYKSGDYWVETFRNNSFPSKSYVNDNIYCSSLEISSGKPNYFYCLNLKTGRVNWASVVGSWSCQPAIVTDSFIYYCSYLGDIHKFDATGIQEWKSKLPSSYSGHSLNSFNNNLFVATVTDGIYEYDLRSGSIVSHIGPNSMGMPLPVFYKNLVLFGGINSNTSKWDHSHNFICQNLTTQKTEWHRTIGEVSGGKIFVHSGRFYIFNGRFGLSCYDITTGSPIWQSDSPRDYRHPLDPHLVFINDEIIYYDTDIDKMVVFDNITGKFLGPTTYQQLLQQGRMQVSKHSYTVRNPEGGWEANIIVTDSLESPADYPGTFNLRINRH